MSIALPMWRLTALAGVFLLVLLSSPAWAQSPATPALTIDGEVGHPETLSLSALAQLPHVDVQATAHGVAGRWSGVPLGALLTQAGVPHGAALRGKAMALYVRVQGGDGYHVVYALAELDPSFGAAPVILADRLDGRPIAANEGPLRVIAPGDRRPARWVRQVVKISVRRDAD